MRTPRFGKSFLLLLSAAFFMTTLPTQAQEEGTEESAPAAATMTQGQAAVIIARRLGLLADSSQAPTQAQAIQLLTSRRVSPKGGWDAEAALSSGNLARMLVQALGLESELSENQIAGDDATPYIDLLIENYGLDVTELGSASDLNNTDTGRMTGGMGGDSSSDLFRAPATIDDNNQQAIPVSQQDLNEALTALVGAAGGGSGQVDSGSGNVTPSAP